MNRLLRYVGFLAIAAELRLIAASVVVQYGLNQCECLGNTSFPSLDGNSPSLDKFSDVFSCPIAEGFTLPTSQGALLDTTGEIISDFALESDTSFPVDNSEGFTVELFVKLQDLIANTARSVTIFDFSGENQVLPNFKLGVSYNPFKPGEFKIVYTTFLVGGSDEFEFAIDPLDDSNKEDIIHIAAGIRLNAGNIVPFACFNGDCLEDNGFVASIVDFDATATLKLLSSTSFDFNAVAESFQLIYLAMHDNALDDEEIVVNAVDTSLLTSFPVVKANVEVEGNEGDELLPFPDDFFFQETRASDDLLEVTVNTIGFEARNDVVSRLNVFEGALFIQGNFFTSSDTVCSTDVIGDFGEFLEASIVDVSNQECVLPAVPLKLCITEENDAPIAEDIVVDVLQSANAVPVTFVAGSDVDDIVQFQQSADGLLTGGSFTVETEPSTGVLLQVNSDGVCLSTAFIVGVVEEGALVRFCYQGDGSANQDSFSFTLTDALDESSETATVTLNPVQLVNPCPDDNSCLATTVERTQVTIDLQVEVLQEDVFDPVVFEITDFPANGVLLDVDGDVISSPISVVNGVVGVGGTTFTLSLLYTPNAFFFNQNEQGSFEDGLGNSLCEGDVAECFEEFTFTASFSGDVQVGVGRIGVSAVDNAEVTIALSNDVLAVNEGEVATINGLVVTFGNKGDVFPITVLLTPFNDAEVRVTFPEDTTVSFESTCNQDEFCDDDITFTTFESVINAALFEVRVLDGASAVVSLGFNDEFTSIRVEVNEQSEAEELDFLVLGGVGAGALLILTLGCLVFTRTRKRRESELTQGSENLKDVELYDEEELAEKKEEEKRKAKALKKKNKPKRKVGKPKPPPAPVSIDDQI